MVQTIVVYSLCFVPMTWEPHTVTTEEHLDPSPVAALAALFDDGLATPVVGDELPPLWHWVALPRWAPSSLLAVDGHPFTGSFLPPTELPRRMFAGGTVSFPGSLRVGDTVRRVATVESVTAKTGRSGALVIVVVAVELYGPDGNLAVVEKQDLIYREAAPPSETGPADPAPAAHRAPGGPPITPAGADTWRWTTDPTLLMRFSAATANAHRIHYDWPYATRVEGYPGLVVHGPLMTLALAETHRLGNDERRIAALTHRNKSPLFCGVPARLRRGTTPTGSTVDLVTDSGRPAGEPQIHTRVDLTLG